MKGNCMKNLVIIGAGGFGRELCSAAREAVGFGERFRIKGFLDANPSALGRFNDYPPVIGAPDDYTPQPDDVFITALGNIAARRRCAALIKGRGGKFISIIHRSAWLGQNTVIGLGSFIAHNVVLTTDITVGCHVDIFHGTEIGHDSYVGDFAHVYSLCSVGGGVKIGKGAVLYPGARIVPGRTIGDGAVVGIGSVVLLNVKPGATVFGNPAAPVAHEFGR